MRLTIFCLRPEYTSRYFVTETVDLKKGPKLWLNSHFLPTRRLKGRTHKAADGVKNIRKFQIYRYDAESGENPRLDTYEVDMDTCGPMVLDAQLK